LMFLGVFTGIYNPLWGWWRFVLSHRQATISLN
jgi:hypothetical protein